jgi:hypothetical protein
MGSAPLDLEAMREIFKDRRTYCAVGKVVDTELASDRSVLFALCDLLTQDRQVVAKVCWDAIGPDAGSFSFPQKDDLVLVEFAEGDTEQCFLTRRISSRTDTIPTQAATGDMVHKALAGKKLHLLSALKIFLGAGTADPTQPLVLGLVAKEFLTTLIDEVLNAPQIGFTPFGPCFLDPTIRANLITYKQTYLTDASTNILSQLSFTERGGS